MFQVKTAATCRLIEIAWQEVVELDEMRQCVDRVREAATGIEPGYRILVDLSHLISMNPACSPFVGEIMDIFAAAHISLVVRVIPDPRKDIGLKILSYFHYGSNVQFLTFENRADAEAHLLG